MGSHPASENELKAFSTGRIPADAAEDVWRPEILRPPRLPAPHQAWPLGVVLIIAPWTIRCSRSQRRGHGCMPANAVILKHSSPFTPPWANTSPRLRKLGPARSLAALTRRITGTWELISGVDIDHVVFTGSVKAAAPFNRRPPRLHHCNWNWPARTPLRGATRTWPSRGVLVDGPCTIRQSCCGISASTVHQSLYAEFLDRSDA